MKSKVDGVLAASGTALASALLLFGIAAVRAVRADAAGAGGDAALIAPVSFAELAAGAADRRTVAAGEIGEAADRDPFRSDRRRPPQPYRIGGAQEPVTDVVVEVAQPTEPPPPAFRLLGTLATTRGGLAVIEVPGVGTRVVSVGSSVGGYRLTGVRGGTATVAMGEFEHTLQVGRPEPRTGAVAAAGQALPPDQANAQEQPPRRGRFRDGGWDQDRGERFRERARERFRERWQQRGGMRPRGGNGQQQQPGGEP